jgi:hypothetical protein
VRNGHQDNQGRRDPGNVAKGTPRGSFHASNNAEMAPALVSSKSHSWTRRHYFAKVEECVTRSGGREEALEGERTMTRVSDDLLMIACATALHGNRDREPAN